MFFIRDLKEKIPGIPKVLEGEHHKRAKERMKESREKTKAYTDRKRRAREVPIKEGEKVYMRQKQSTTKPP